MRLLTLLTLTALLGLAGLTPLAAAPAPAAGGKGIVLPFAAKSQLVIQVNGFDRTRDRIHKLVAAAAPGEAARIKQDVDAGLNMLLGERKLTAIPGDQRWFIAARELGSLGEEETPIAVLIPVTDAKAFRESFLTADERKSFKKGDAGVASFTGSFKGNETTLYFVEQPGFVVLSPSKDTAEIYANKYDKASTDTLGPDVSKAFLDSDIGIYLNMDAINDQYGQQIQAARQFLDFALQQGAGMGGINQKQIEAAKVMFKGLFQGLEDGRALVIATEFRPEGLAVRLMAHFADDSVTGKMLRNEDLSTLADLGKLPAGQAMYSGGGFGKTITEAIKGLTQKVAAAEDDDKTEKAISTYLDAITAAGPGPQYQAASIPGATLAVQRFKDANKALAAETALFKSLPTGTAIQNVVIKDKPAIAEKANTVGKIAFTEVKITFDLEATVKELPEQLKEATIASMKKMLGGDTTTTYYGSDGQVMLTVTAKDWAAAKSIVEEYLAGKTVLADDAAYKLTRTNLPAQTSMAMIVDTGKLIVFGSGYLQSMAGAMPGFPIQVPELKPVKGAPAYVGVALSLKPEVMQVDLFVPATAVGVARKVLAPVLQSID